jgi:hypothetical protein
MSEFSSVDSTPSPNGTPTPSHPQSDSPSFKNVTFTDDPNQEYLIPSASSAADQEAALDTDPASTSSTTDGAVDPRRARRLERNRESARLSRARRKDYLTELEAKVVSLTAEMDKARIAHVANAVQYNKNARAKVLADLGPSSTPDDVAKAVEALTIGSLGAGRRSLRLCLQFYTAQLRSLVLPVNQSFLMWLTLQNDAYFLSGRDASQRLSAARIGQSLGTETATPDKGHWPLLCSTTSLSYEQEERVRAYQREILLDNDVWMARHTAKECMDIIDNTYDALKGLGKAVATRCEGVLNISQRIALSKYVAANKDRISKAFPNPPPPPMPTKDTSATIAGVSTSSAMGSSASTLRDIAAVRTLISEVILALPSHPGDVVDGAAIKKLSRRPAFETLASDSIDEVKTKGVKRGSSGNLLKEGVKRGSSGNLLKEGVARGMGVSVGEVDAREPKVPSVTPEAAQNAFVRVFVGGGTAAPTVPAPVEPPTHSGFPMMPPAVNAVRMHGGVHGGSMDTFDPDELGSEGRSSFLTVDGPGDAIANFDVMDSLYQQDQQHIYFHQQQQQEQDHQQRQQQQQQQQQQQRGLNGFMVNVPPMSGEDPLHEPLELGRPSEEGRDIVETVAAMGDFEIDFGLGELDGNDWENGENGSSPDGGIQF